MKIIIIILFFVSMQLYAFEIDSLPRSFTYINETKPLTKEKDLDFKVLPSFDNDSLINEEKELREKFPNLPDLYGIETKVDYALNSTGTWDTLDNGDKIWRLRIKCPKAYLNNGNVGIGVTDPQKKLVVDGTICAEEIRVSLTGSPCWSDFVFDEDYELMPLEELEADILKNKHLPGIPSSEEVTENGIALGEMQAKLLQKIEELTLYVIDLKKEINVLKNK